MMIRDSDRQQPHTTHTASAFGTRARCAFTVLTAAALLIAPVAAAEGGEALASMPALQLTSLENGTIRIQDWLGGRPAVINLWATWCAPCRTEMPSLQRLATLLASEGIRVLALSVDTDHNLVREFVLKYGITMPVSIANSPNQAMAAIGVVALPHTLYVGADGRILGGHLGQRDWADPAAVREVRNHLGTKSPPRR